MKSSRISVFACALLIAGASFAEDKPDVSSPDTLIATVNGVPYPLDVFRLFYMERLQASRGESSPAFQQQVFDEFMSLVVASQEGERRKIEETPNVVAALKLERMKVLSNATLAAMASEVEPTEEEIETAYERVKEQATRMEYKARHILVKEEEEAKKLIKKLDKGADFAELAEEHSLGPTAKKGGELGWFDPSQMVAPFAEAVAAMEPGSYSKEPVHTQFGWHIIRLEEARKAQAPSLEEAKPRLVGLVKRQKIAEEVAKMRNNAMVELNEDIVRIKQDEDSEATEK